MGRVGRGGEGRGGEGRGGEGRGRVGRRGESKRRQKKAPMYGCTIPYQGQCFVRYTHVMSSNMTHPTLHMSIL